MWDVCPPVRNLEICREAFLNNLPSKSFVTTVFAHFEVSFNPFASIGRTGTSNSKVKVKVSCLDISFMT